MCTASRIEPITTRSSPRAIEHASCCIVFAKMQIKRGKWFVFEHLASAYTWHEPCMQKLLSMPGVDWQTADHCRQYGLVAKDPDGVGKPAKKPTRCISNGWCLLEELC